MPMKPPQACRTPGCGKTRPCPQHPTPTQARHPREGIYHSTAWARLRKRVLAEEPTCRWCRSARSDCVDHVVEIADGGAPFDRANLVGSCTPCNVAKGQRARQRREAMARADALGV